MRGAAPRPGREWVDGAGMGAGERRRRGKHGGRKGGAARERTAQRARAARSADGRGHNDGVKWDVTRMETRGRTAQCARATRGADDRGKIMV